MRPCGLYLLLAMAPVALAGPAEACTTCDAKISMTKTQLSCLERRIGTYLRSKADPVMITLLSCKDTPVADSATAGRAAPTVAPIVDAKGDADADQKVLFLTRKQIDCLRANLPKLKAAEGEPVVFTFNGCR